jgi:hypothetical protein
MATGRIRSESAPTMCEGSSALNGNRNPVILVSTVVVRKRPSHPSSLVPAIRPPTTARPAKIPATLKTTWMSVRVGMSRSIGPSSQSVREYRGPEKLKAPRTGRK